MPLDTPVRVVRELASRGYNADREAVTLLARAPNPARAVERAVAGVPEDVLTLSADHVRSTLETGAEPQEVAPADAPTHDSGGTVGVQSADTLGVTEVAAESTDSPPAESGAKAGPARGTPPPATIDNDVTGQSTGTGVYDDFVAVFRDRFERLSRLLRTRVNARPTSSLQEMPGGSEAALIGMVADVRSTRGGHWLVELEDTTGTFPVLLTKGRDAAGIIDELLLDEVIAVEGRLADDAGILFVDALYFPDVPRTFQPSRADRHVQAALVSDIHVGSETFHAEAWDRFSRWLHTEEADAVEYLLIAGDMVEGVGVYPGQDAELDIVDVYEQYEAFAERLKAVPGELEIVMIPGNHDAVRLAEPQPAFDEELRRIMSPHDARVTGNPSVVTIEGVSVLMYHGVSLDEVIAELPAERANYDEPHKAMYQLLRKRHLAPQFGERTRLAPERRDYLVIEEVPDVFHAGHVHKLGYGRYHNVTAINSGCWQTQTDFQRRVNLDPDVGYAPILDLDTLDVTIRKFA